MTTNISFEGVVGASSQALRTQSYKVSFSFSDNQGKVFARTMQTDAETDAEASALEGTLTIELPRFTTPEGQIIERARQVLHDALTRLAEMAQKPST